MVVGEIMGGMVNVGEGVGDSGLINVGVSVAGITIVDVIGGVSDKVDNATVDAGGIPIIGVKLRMVGGREGVTAL
jgi:hypothetical protein